MPTCRSVDSTARFNRREFAQLSAGLAAAIPTAFAAAAPRSNRSVIQILLVGGPSQLETWDPKPDAPADVRGPLCPIATRIPGVFVSEAFPQLAERMDRVALVRTLCHHEPPLHETGLQMLQTGDVDEHGLRPHLGAVVAARSPRTPADAPAWVVLGGPLGDTGVRLPQGQDHGSLDPSANALYCHGAPSTAVRNDLKYAERYGRTPIGRSLWAARRWVEAGVRVVTVNMFQTVFGGLSWDAHAAGGRSPTTLDDYRRSIGPAFDQALAALLDDLQERGRIDDVLVVAAGEMGRTPLLNERGGRDHWTGCWSVLLAGGGIQGGAVLGSSDRIASEPCHRPVSPAELLATQAAALGAVDASCVSRPWLQANPLWEILENPAAIAGFAPQPYTLARNGTARKA